ncbi:type I restriction enzyme, R subunit [Rubritalea squalenifaciens DSM 18772]|uniref:Type I restriction enzyme, R subunit n=1 Tax=Rubritalea squalenifaciens DSM 18772 TaxID=1123071 RepID=A0A1M6PKT6_9BACT|nr:DEAD/DEAH box helicase family protein [Rubritalea squalenifaciens]SHK08592.1 type I restriction enzyme, R subunit [Rubritalea squalenifaciens DSM 18772]
MSSTPSNFSFLTSEFPDFALAAKLAEKAVFPDPHAACFHCRRTLELVVQWLYKVEAKLGMPYDHSLGSLIHHPPFQNLISEAIFQKARLIQKVGNQAVHGKQPIYQITALQTLEELHHLLYWLARTYSRIGAAQYDAIRFDKTLVPFPQTSPSKADKDQLKKKEAELDQYAEKLAKQEKERSELDQQIVELQAELALAKKANEQVPDPHDYSEADTRKYLIDAELRRSGWDPEAPKATEYEVSGMPNNKGIGYVDYVLWGDDGKPLAIVEAKRTTKDPKIGQQQAKLYADCLEKESGQRPLIFYTNGYETWFWDDLNYPHRPVAGFYKAEELQRLITRRDSLLPLRSSDINSDIAGRYYQTRAISSICELLAQKRRKALLVMATGTGKTRTSIAMVDLLQRANWAKNVLFLADRTSLVNQAANAFKAHLPECSPVNLVTEKDKQGRVYTCTYPTMMGLIDSTKNGESRFSPGHFDLIVIDEAHRSVYQKYQAIFSYFDSLLVGLTATPREEIDKNTYELFDIENGVPTDAYELEQAVSDGFLVPPKVKKVDMKFPREGIKYDDLTESEKAVWDELDWGDRSQSAGDREVGSGAINKWLFNKDTADKMFQTLMEHGHKVNKGDRLAKTIIFARNHDHALFLEDRFNYHYPDKKGHFARVIDNYANYPQSLIDAFSLSESDPHIAISVDMMDTGIDVPEVANLVFFKPVYSKIKFWQMIGRGTRLCPDLFGENQDKEDFRIFDFCGNFDYFEENPEGLASTNSESLGTRLFRLRTSLLQALQNSPENLQSTTWKTHREHLRVQIQSMHPDNFEIRLKQELVERYQAQSFWEHETVPHDDLEAMANELATLPDTLEPEKLEAKQWDATLLAAQLSTLGVLTNKLVPLQHGIIETASKLEEKANIPAVKVHLALIQAIQDADFWQDIHVDTLEEIRVKLRDLVHLIRKGYSPPVYTPFEDEIRSMREDEPVVIPTMTGEQYEKKVRAELASNLDRIEIQKIRTGQALTPQDLNELESMLVKLGERQGEKLLGQLIERSQAPDLVTFIKTCVGLDAATVLKHFEEYLNKESFSPAQIRFIELIIAQLSSNGVISAGALYHPPFSSIHAGGPDGLFPDENVLDGIFDKIHELSGTEA